MTSVEFVRVVAPLLAAIGCLSALLMALFVIGAIVSLCREPKRREVRPIHTRSRFPCGSEGHCHSDADSALDCWQANVKGKAVRR